MWNAPALPYAGDRDASFLFNDGLSLDVFGPNGVIHILASRFALGSWGRYARSSVSPTALFGASTTGAARLERWRTVSTARPSVPCSSERCVSFLLVFCCHWLVVLERGLGHSLGRDCSLELSS